MKLVFSVIIIGLALCSCKTYSDDDKLNFDKKIKEYISEKRLELDKSESGLYFKVLDKGNGKAIKYKDSVSFKYKGTLLDGSVFDEHLDSAITFRVDQLISAWQEAMFETTEGGKVFLISPPQLGYGDHELAKIPKNSCLIFEMEIVEVK